MRWDRGPNLPDQAFLLDFTNQRLFFGPIEIWAQEFYYITGVLVLAALSLFLVTAIAGRMWCGYACPQTVWTDLMVTVERFFQGDRNARLRLDASPWTLTKIWKKGATHASWLSSRSPPAVSSSSISAMRRRCGRSCGRATPRSSPTRSWHLHATT